MAVADRLARIRSIPIFSGLDKDAHLRIAALATELEVPAGQVLARTNDTGAGVFVIEEGTVVVEARRRTIELGPGEFVGELSLLVPESTRVARVRAETPVRCLLLNRLDFEELLDDEPRLALAMLRVIAHRLWKVMQE